MSTQKSHRRGSSFGYVISILFNSALLYVIFFVPLWDYIPMLTDKFVNVRDAMGLSVGVTIFMYCTFLAFDPRWFRSLMQAISNIFAIYSLWVIRQVFPLDVSDSIAGWVNMGIVFLMGIMVLATLIEFFTSIRYFRRSIAE